MRPTEAMSIRRHILILSFAVAGLAACSGAPAILDDGIRTDIPSEGPEIGPLEEQAKAHVEAITTLLVQGIETPEQTVMAIGGYLQEHKDAIRDNATAIAERLGQMTDDERVYYEDHFSAYFTDATQAWVEALHAFREVNPQEASRVDGLMIYFD